MPARTHEDFSLLAPGIIKQTSIDAIKKLDPRCLWRNPVMFSVEIASAITLTAFAASLGGAGREPVWFSGIVSFLLCLTVFFSTFAEAVAEGRGKARAAPVEVHAEGLDRLRAARPFLRHAHRGRQKQQDAKQRCFSHAHVLLHGAGGMSGRGAGVTAPL